MACGSAKRGDSESSEAEAACALVCSHDSRTGGCTKPAQQIRILKNKLWERVPPVHYRRESFFSKKFGPGSPNTATLRRTVLMVVTHPLTALSEVRTTCRLVTSSACYVSIELKRKLKKSLQICRGRLDHGNQTRLWWWQGQLWTVGAASRCGCLNLLIVA